MDPIFVILNHRLVGGRRWNVNMASVVLLTLVPSSPQEGVDGAWVAERVEERDVGKDGRFEIEMRLFDHRDRETRRRMVVLTRRVGGLDRLLLRFTYPGDLRDTGFLATAPVGSFQPNAFGLYDMLGNVLEWCEDIYAGDAYSQHQRSNPIYDGDGTLRGLRGGCWLDDPRHVRCAFRNHDSPQYRDRYAGFRLARTF